MKTSITTAFFLFCLTFSFAQPVYNVEKFNLETGRKDKYYYRLAKRNVENKKSDSKVTDARYVTNMGLYNAAFALSKAEKKGTISDIQEILINNYARITNENQIIIDQLSEENENIDITVADKARILNYYTIMQKYNTVLKTIPPQKFEGAKKKDPDVVLDIKDFSEHVSTAKSALDEYIEKAAAFHYDQARGLARGEGLEENKNAAKEYRYSYEYISDFRDAKERYAVCKDKGTTRLGLTEFENIAGSSYGNIGFSIQSDILSSFSGDQKEFEFFEVLDRDALEGVLQEQKLSLSGLMADSNLELGEIPGVHSLFYGQVILASADRERLDPVNEEFSKKVKVGEEKYVDDNGKEKTRDIKETVTVTMRRHEKRAHSTVEISFRIVDVATGSIIASDNLQGTNDWSGEWYTYGYGDKRAIPRSVRKSEVQYISSSQLVSGAANRVSSRLYEAIAKYGRQVSQ